MPSITVLDSTGATQTVQTVPAVGRAAATLSLPVALETTDSANLAALVTAAQDVTTPSPVKIDQTTDGVTNKVNNSASLRASGTATKANVTGVATSATILASNANRKGATIWNDSTAILYLDLTGGTATATSCSKKLIADEYYEVPFGLSGLITGIWASAAGAARVTEIV